MSLPFFDGADHLAPMSVVGGVFEAFPHTNSQKAENQSWDHISRSTTSLKPEDLASLDGDRYSQSSSDEYFSQTSDSTSHTSPLSDSWSEHNSRRQHAVAASQTTKSDDLQRPTSSTNSPGNTRSHSVQHVNIEQDVTIRLKSQQHSAAADQSFGGLTIDTSRIANDAQPSRMRPEPRIPLEERSSRRRNFAGPLGGSAPPPKLKRDTEQTDAIVKMIVLFCTNLISSIWTPGTVQPGSSQSRTGSNVLPLQVFITETLRRSKTSYSTLQIALYYLILLKQALPSSGLARQASQGCRALQCGRRMFLTALILASKYLQDRNYTARAWSKISGLPLKEINENERRYLSIVCWNLHVPKATFENWSKIVLSVCRLSIDAEAHGREQDVACAFPSSPPSPGSGPSGQTCGLKIACEATLSALQTWWAINLKSLCTDIVNCPRKTEQYVGAITPFRTTPLLPRPVRDESWSWKSAPSDTLAQSNGRCVTRLPSLESMTKSFFNQDAHDSPAVSSKPVPRRMLANLPTPQQTPYAHEMWTPQLTRPGIRSRPSASALASIDQRRCPLAANLDTCPPPMPRPQTFQSSQAWTAWRQSIQSTLPDRSTTSSPESVISDASSVFSVPGFARSRSSSISSSMSWMAPENAGQAPSDENNDKPTLCRRILEDSHLLALQQPATRLNALSLNPVRNDVIFDETPKGQTHCWTEGPNLNAQEPAVLQEQKSSESSSIRNYHQLSTSSQSTPTEPLHQAKVASYLPKSCRPRLDKSKTASFELGEAAPMHLRSLKRSRTTSVDITSVPQTWSSSFNMASSPADLGFRGTTLSAEELEKEIVNPSCGDKKPRKPISCGTGHNKRTALSVPSPAGTNYARQVLHQDWYSTITPQDIQIQG